MIAPLIRWSSAPPIAYEITPLITSDCAPHQVELGPVAAELGLGERLRLHVCSAAHPRWMRNLCSSPEIPLARQTSGSFASCCVRVSVDDEASVLMLPLLDTAPAR